MQPARPHRHRRHSKALCLLLTCVLALAPLLSAAQPLLMDAATSAAEPVSQMPCHDDHAADPAADTADCPHCNGDAPAGQCNCCDQAAPSALVTPLFDNHHLLPTNRGAPTMVSDALPRSPGERLYRPPIQSS